MTRASAANSAGTWSFTPPVATRYIVGAPIRSPSTNVGIPSASRRIRGPETARLSGNRCTVTHEIAGPSGSRGRSSSASRPAASRRASGRARRRAGAAGPRRSGNSPGSASGSPQWSQRPLSESAAARRNPGRTAGHRSQRWWSLHASGCTGLLASSGGLIPDSGVRIPDSDPGARSAQAEAIVPSD